MPTSLTRSCRRAAVIGAGAWGTALASTLLRAGLAVRLWGRDQALADGINASHINSRYLPGAMLDPQLLATTDLAASLEDADLLLAVVPTQELRGVLTGLRPLLDRDVPVVICCKGLERGSHARPSRIAAETLGASQPVLVLSGPSFAAEVVRGLPTAVTLAADSLALADALAGAMGHTTFRIYPSDDIAGVEIGGAVKNVLAIAAGVVNGRGLGASAQAALITRGFAELSTFAACHGARPETLTGLSCLGDLILTCNSPQSRNFAFGVEIGKGRSAADILASRKTVTEGVHTVSSVLAMAARHGLDLPICQAVGSILDGEANVDEAIASLLARPRRREVGTPTP
ncbi:MAG: NAD(P)H-dependent glycerol-3-phosphate dehydrogenase [Hyphomicrobiaceae bacterium]